MKTKFNLLNFNVPSDCLQITWPSECRADTTSGEVDVDSWWSHIESKILEGITFKDIQMEKLEASRIPPWIPPACRGRVVNTEHLKGNTRKHQSPPTPTGCPKTLANLICQGVYSPLNLEDLSVTKLKEICELVNIPKELATTKV